MKYDVKYNEQTVRERIAATANALRKKGILTEDTVYLVMLNGGLWFATHLFDALGGVGNKVFMIKGHSYTGVERGEFLWDCLPDEQEVTCRKLVILDDICDSGATINIIYRFFKTKAERITFVTLLERTTRQIDADVELYSCIQDDSQDFFVGCGLDDNETSRFLPYVGVLQVEN